MSRKYETIWIKIKSDGQCIITAPKALHPRIKKAVLKEKSEDLGYKMLLQENEQTARLKVTVEGAIMKFVLRKSTGLDML